MDSRLVWVLVAIGAFILWSRYSSGGPAASGVGMLPDGTAAPIAPVGANPLAANTASPYVTPAVQIPQSLSAGTIQPFGAGWSTGRTGASATLIR